MIRSESKGLVLIADDTAESLTMLNEALSSAGYTVLVAMDGIQALNIAERMVPDLILLDAIMPNMDGFDACRALKENAELQDIPVIFMTGLSDSEHVVRGLECGGVDYLTKPVRLNELLARAQVHINNARKTQSARGALNELGQPAFSCSLHGEILWCTQRALEVLAALNCNSELLARALQQQAGAWLSRAPQKHSQFKLVLSGQTLTLRLLGQPYPGEFLLRLMDEDDALRCQDLRQQFALTERESEVLLWLARGKSNQDIGQILTMSPRTVNKHLEQIFRKLGVENRTSAAAVSLGVLALNH
ncbi:MAG: response regulator transcription factor [Saccharospirillaceae bacterium]|nr:response regulator transcription factor [Saccharospirillaceae bacterium]MCD8533118.1 response regulator transcription factor [Saccharospirillaceae bacterium]